MKQCECGSKTFNSNFTLEATFTLDDGILTATEEEDLDGDDIYICTECGKEYTTCDFKEIIHK